MISFNIAENIGVPDFGANMIGQNPNIGGRKWGGHNKHFYLKTNCYMVFAMIHFATKMNHILMQ